MPIYEFTCESCGQRFEFMKIKSDDRAQCPKCKETEPKKLKKMISSNTSFNLKGRGWYRDGYS